MAQSGNEARDATLQDFDRQPRVSSNTPYCWCAKQAARTLFSHHGPLADLSERPDA
jgi:hypothetical protein